MLERDLIAGNYKYVQTLTQCEFANTCVYKHINSDHQLIIEHVAIRSEDHLQLFNRSLFLLETMEHPNIRQFYCHLQEQEEHCLALEYVPGGDLESAAEKGMRGFQIARWVRQVTLALQYMHKLNTPHLSVRPQNILLTSADFDKADAKLSVFDSTYSSFRSAADAYSAPETSHPSEKADIWSLGCLTYRLFTGRLPFNSRSEEELQRTIEESEIPNRLVALNFIRRCLIYDPDTRPDTEQLLNDPFLVEAAIVDEFCKHISWSYYEIELLKRINQELGSRLARNVNLKAIKDLELFELRALQFPEFRDTVDFLRSQIPDPEA